MGFFNLFKKPVTVDDEFFGVLRVIDFKDSSKGYFEGNGYFAPTGNEIEYLIEGATDGPTDKQKQFYRNLQLNFNQYIVKITPLIEDEFRNWKEDFVIQDFKKEFELVCITIPRFDVKPLIWDMAFTTIHDDDHHVTVDFIDYEPNGVLIDG